MVWIDLKSSIKNTRERRNKNMVYIEDKILVTEVFNGDCHEYPYHHEYIALKKGTKCPKCKRLVGER